MPAEAIANPELLGSTGYPNRKRWTRAECEALESAGLWEGERLELVEGDLISRMGKKRPHVTTMILVMKWLVDVFGALYVTPGSADRRCAAGQSHKRTGAGFGGARPAVLCVRD